ncbi:hypothetical protein HDU96_000935 [Phlyctochytrium bullatum]|nr:hypothetical protein HDU96_000935 [Phlyctochytrium bullatum]
MAAAKLKLKGPSDVFRSAMIGSLVSRRGGALHSPQAWLAASLQSPTSPTTSASSPSLLLARHASGSPMSLSRVKVHPGIPWPSSPEINVNLSDIPAEAQVLIRKGLDTLAQSEVGAASASSTAASQFFTASAGRTEDAGQADPGSNAYFKLVPSAISAICVAIIFAAFNVTTFETERPQVVVEETSEEPESPPRPKERVTGISHSMRRQIQDQFSKERIYKVLGQSLAALKVSLVTVDAETEVEQPTSFKFEHDDFLLSLLQKAYPSLFTSMEFVGDVSDSTTVCGSVDENVLESSKHELMEALSGEPGKFDLAKAVDALRNSSQAVILLVSRWLSVASLVKALLPPSVRSEIEFLGHYLSYCVENEVALNLPIMFPSDYEMDRSGAIVKINTPAIIFILRSLAKTAAGVAVSLLPYVRPKRPTLRRRRSLPRSLSFESLSESKRAEIEEGPAPVLGSPFHTHRVPAAPSQIEPTLTSASALWQVCNLPRVDITPPELPLPQTPPRMDSPRLESPLRNESPRLESPLSSTSGSPKSKGIPIPKMADRVALRRMSVGSRFFRTASNDSLYSRSFGSDSEFSRLSTSPAGEEWESFRIREAGIPVEILKLEFEAIRAGNTVDSSVLSDENNNLDAW